MVVFRKLGWRNANTRKIMGKDSIYKFFGIGNDKGTNGVGIHFS